MTEGLCVRAVFQIRYIVGWVNSAIALINAFHDFSCKKVELELVV